MAARVRSVGTAVSGTGALTPPLPAIWAEDDILCVEVRTAGEPIASISGYTEVGTGYTSGAAAGTASTSIQFFWRRATASESDPSVPDSGNSTSARMFAVAGCPASGDPIMAYAGDVAASAATGATIPGVTTDEPNALVAVMVANEADTATAQTSGWANANLEALLEKIDSNTTSGNGGGFGTAFGRKVAAGAVGDTTATLATSSVQARMSVAFRSADGGDLDAGIKAHLAEVAAGTAHKIWAALGDSLEAGDLGDAGDMGANAKNTAVSARMPLYFSFPASNASFIGDGAANLAAGRTPTEYNNLITLGAGWSADDSQVSAGGAPYTSSGSGASLSFAAGETFDRIVVLHARYAGGADYTVDIGGATLATLDMNGAPDAVIKTAPIACTSGVNTLYFDSTGAGGYIYGAYVYQDAVKELHVVNLGWAGSTSGDWNNSATFKALQVVAALAPHILTIEQGNDLLAGTSETTVKANLRAIAEAQLNRGGEVLLVPPHYIPSSVVATATQDLYTSYFYDLAFELGVPIYDVKTYADWSSYATAAGNSYMATSPNVHGSAVGYDDNAQKRATRFDVAGGASYALDGASAGVGSASGAIGALRPLAGAAAGSGAAGLAIGRTAPLAGAAAGAATAILAAAGVRPLAGVSAGQGGAAGAIGALKPLAGLASGAGDAAGAVGISKPLAGTSAGTGAASADLVLPGGLAGTSAGQGSASAAFGALRPLAGAASGSASAGLALGRSTPLSGAADGSGTAILALVGVKPLAGATAGQGASSAALGASKPLAGTSAGAGDATADLGLLGGLSGLAAGAGAAAASLGVLRPLAGAASGAASEGLALGRSTPLTGAADGASTAMLTAAVVKPLAGAATGLGVASGGLLARRPLAGLAAGAGAASAALEPLSPIVIAPPERILRIPAEARVLAIPAETRICAA